MAKVNGAVLLGLCLLALWNIDGTASVQERPSITVPYGGIDPTPLPTEIPERSRNDHGIG